MHTGRKDRKEANAARAAARIAPLTPLTDDGIGQVSGVGEDEGFPPLPPSAGPLCTHQIVTRGRLLTVGVGPVKIPPASCAQPQVTELLGHLPQTHRSG